jgi:uncharacterized membrane protein
MTMTDPKQYERLMSRILRIGVTVSSILMASGLLVESLQTATVVIPDRNPTLGELLRQLLFAQPAPAGGSFATTLMFLGLITLMLTPFLRVLTTLAIFWSEKDWRFVGVATLVFLLLAGQVIYSLYS